MFDYYANRQDSLEKLYLAVFCRDNNIVYQSRLGKEADELYNVQNDDNDGSFEAEKQCDRKTASKKSEKEQILLSLYYVDEEDEIDTIPSILVLFLHFCDEDAENHVYPCESLKKNFCLYRCETGTGEPFLTKILIKAAKIDFMRSGDHLSKRSLLFMSPTILGNGEATESGKAERGTVGNF